MKITFKKALASIAMLSLLGGFALNVNAAAITVDSVTYNGTDVVTVTKTGQNFDTTDTITGFSVIAGLDNSDKGGVIAAPTANTFTITGLGVLTDDVYSVSFVTAAGNFSSATFTVGTADQIQVTANVLPILTMKVTGAAAFGDLVAGTIATATTTTITVNTNASAGYSLSVANSANGLNKGSAAANDVIAAVAGNTTDLASNYGYGIQATIAAGSPGSAGGASATGLVDGVYALAAEVVSPMTNGGTTLSTADGAVIDQVTTVTYKAKIDALQETGNYTDTITYSITGAF